MASVLIEDLDDALHQRLAKSAALHERPIEIEARELLRTALARQACGPKENIVDAARRLFGPEHGVDLDIPPRGSEPERLPPDFSDGY